MISYRNIKMAPIAAHLNAGIIQWSNRYIISLFPPPPYPLPPFSPSLISLMDSVDVKHHAYLLTMGEMDKVHGKEGKHEWTVSPHPVFNAEERRFHKWRRDTVKSLPVLNNPYGFCGRKAPRKTVKSS